MKFSFTLCIVPLQTLKTHVSSKIGFRYDPIPSNIQTEYFFPPGGMIRAHSKLEYIPKVLNRVGSNTSSLEMFLTSSWSWREFLWSVITLAKLQMFIFLPWDYNFTPMRTIFITCTSKIFIWGGGICTVCMYYVSSMWFVIRAVGLLDLEPVSGCL